MKIVKTGDNLIRNGIKYKVVIADDNIFVICKYKTSSIVNHEHPEIYANQSEINTLEDLNFSSYS